jgi:methyltransferase-like protein
MSQYLKFKLVNKANPDIKVGFNCWSTSIARGIENYFEGIFRYTDIYTKLDYETMQSYIETLHNGIEEYKENLRKEQEKKKEYIEYLLKAQSEVVVSAIKEDICNIDESIIEWQDDIDTWSDVENNLNFILETLGNNEDDWELVYKNS